MIIPTYSEDEILRELIFDYKIVKRMAKKIAIAYLNKNKKRGGFIRETEYDSYTITTISKNKWNVEIEYDQTKKIPWLFRACCKVEGEKKTKDYYLVRGLNTEKPYYVKITSHALKRVKERNKFSYSEALTLDLLACWTFEHRETAICMRYIDLKYSKILLEMDNTEELDDMSYLVLTNRGAYFAKKTKEGNYIFKTYISSMMGMAEALKFQNNITTKWAKEGELLTCMILLHQYYNKSLWEKDQLENMLYKAMDKKQEIILSGKELFFLLKN